MRRISVLLAFAVILLSAIVGYTYKLRTNRAKARRSDPTPQIQSGYDAVAKSGWEWKKDDPQTNKPVVRVSAKSFQAAHDPSTYELRDLALRLYDKNAGSYTYVRSGKALFDVATGVMKSEGPVSIVMNVPSDKDAEKPEQVAKLVQVQTAGVTYETKSGKADTNQPASFKFSEGGGQALGVAYDPATGELHLKSRISLDWLGNGPAENKMHIEAGDLVYKEKEQKIYLSPWSKMQRKGTTIQARNSLVTLQDGILHQIDSDHATGSDVREDKRTQYSADKMIALFDENGTLVNIVGEGNAKVLTSEASSRTTITGNRADLRFAVDTKTVNGQLLNESNLHLVLADGHAVAESDPVPQPGVAPADTHILRSEHIVLQMKPGGKDVQDIETPSQAQLEFKPNKPDQPHRILNASHLRILYGEGSYIGSFVAWNASTRTDKPVSAKEANKGKAAAPALTWSDQLAAKFVPSSNQVETIEQTGNFRYQEGARKASANKAFLEQAANRITLVEHARVSDDAGSAVADKIVMNQQNGDMDAMGHVVSTHAPDKNQKPGTSMLDNSKTMQAKADQMQTRDDNSDIFYEGHVVMWQGANRIAANTLQIDRDSHMLHAAGNVVSELVDKSSDNAQKAASTRPAVFTVVRAEDLAYRDDTRVADYTGGVTLTRDKMTVTSKTLKAFLSPKSATGSDDSSLDHAFADGDVTVSDVVAPGRTRTGTSEHCEYYTKLDKVVMNGGSPQMLDSYKGLTKGRQLTYFSDDDRMIVEGEKKDLAFTQMKKK
jgi:lipopolysaccharide export system protein LptA